MKIIGTFKDLYENDITLEIENTSVSGETVYIEDDGELYFNADEPIKITDNTSNLMDVLCLSNMTINFHSKNYAGDLFYGNNELSTTVKVSGATGVLFDGIIDPLMFNQDYNSWYDEFSVNCIDKLATLQFRKYKNIKDKATYEEQVMSGGFKTFQELLVDILPSGSTIWYDQSVSLPSISTTRVFENLRVSESTFFGDDYDSVWTNDQVITEILRYLNLHIRQIGSDFYVFNWQNQSLTDWVNIVTYEHKTIAHNTINVTAEKHHSDDTNVSVEESFNQIKVTCELQGQSTVIESPLDDCRSLFTNKQKYMTEYISEGEGHDAFDAFRAMLKGEKSNYDAAKIVDWYMQALYNKYWKFYSAQGEVNELYDQDDNGQYINQWKLSARLKEKNIEPALIALGSVEYEGGLITDDSNKSKVSMSNCLAISLNGNKADNANHIPTEDQVRRRTPLAEYISPHSASVFSPVDDLTTNYLLITGKMCFIPIQAETAPYRQCASAASGNTSANGHWEYPPVYVWVVPDDPEEQGMGEWQILLDEDGNPILDYDADPVFVRDSEDDIVWNDLWHHTVPSDNNGDGRYYTRKWWAFKYPGVAQGEDVWVDGGLHPMTADKSNHELEYEGSTKGDSNDTWSTLEVLDCELIIGNKRCIWYNNQFQWVELGQEPTETNSDGTETTVTTFPISVNPKIGDKIIGDEFDIKNTLTIEDNVNEEGTAIPIRKEDNLSGKVIFRIIGVVNNLYNFVHKHNHREWIFWKCSKWDENYYYVLSHAESIMIKDLKMELVSDNAGQGTEYRESGEELVYLSTENDKYININEDTTFKIITQPTTIYCLENGISTEPNMNAVMYQNGGYVNKVTSLITNEMALPEEHYVAQYYEMMHTPKITLETTLYDDGDINYQNIYHYPPLNRNFQVISIERDLANKTAKLKLREI
jgi:hypothetical protein